MKTLELENYGVKELDPEGMRKTNGGFWLMVAGLVCTYIIVEAALNPNAHIRAFREGYAMAE